jgi:hypothetical protein
MFELFQNPANVLIGGALITSPILIHLINRMRFKRVRWAAMEFLLRSQKRNRRRLIIEQLLLLAMRIALVLLAGLLLGRFLGFSWAGFQSAETLHVVVLDDRLSMGDHWRDADGRDVTSFQVGKSLIERELAKLVAEARTPQRLVFFYLSRPDISVDTRLNEDSLKDLSAELARRERPSFLHLNLLKGLEVAQTFFDKNPEDNCFLHLVSDFRQRQWNESEGDALIHQFEAMTKAGVKIHLVDTAHPYRSERQRIPLYHENLAVVELRPETRVAAQDSAIQFNVVVANFSASEHKNVRVTVKVNGGERLEASVPLASLPPGQTSGTFQVTFNQLGLNVVSANLEDEEVGLQADNVRYAVVEVRRQVPVLVVDGDMTNSAKPGGDLFHLRTLLNAARGFEIVAGSVADLERPSLQQFPCVYLLNVRELNDQALKSLEDYVRGGGSVAFFLGDRVNGEYYTKRLYNSGRGIFPVPIADRPTPVLSEEEKQQRVLDNLNDPRPQLLIRKPGHPIFAEVAPFRDLFNFLTIDRHYSVLRSQWNREQEHIEELATLPNERPLTDYQSAAQEIVDALPTNDPHYARFRTGLEQHKRSLQDALAGKELNALAAALSDSLQDRAEPGTADRPRLLEFWKDANPSVLALRTRIEQLYERVQYGDPLIVAGRYGKGRTVAFLTTAGKAWNDWAGGSPASVTYPVVLLDLQKYLTSTESEEHHTVGAPIEIEVDSSRFETRARAFYQANGPDAETARSWPPAASDAAGSFGRKDLGEQAGALSGNRLTFVLDRDNVPGVYQCELIQRAEGGARPEPRAYAVNVDTVNESDLRRTSSDELERFGKMSTPVSGSFLDLIVRPNDLSESAWIYVVFLVVLVAEQALARHLSFHLRGNVADVPGVVRAKQPTAA